VNEMSVPVLIVGAGLAGLATSLLLSRYGVAHMLTGAPLKSILTSSITSSPFARAMAPLLLLPDMSYTLSLTR
jgi:glycine/D-amino acid oxidase-like deaminating enzyme